MSRKQPEFAKALRLRDESFMDDLASGENQGGEGALRLKDLFLRLLGRWHWIALGLVFGLAVGFFQVWRAIPQYQARATVLVRDYNVSVMGQVASAEFDLRNTAALETVRAGLTTFDLCEAVASDPTVRELRGIVPPGPRGLPFTGKKDEEGEASTAPAAPQLAGMIRSWLSVNVRPGTRLIDITVRHHKPLVAQTVANRLIEHYMKRRTESRSGDQKDTLDYLVAESKRVKTELQEAQNVLASYAGPLEAEKALAAAETAVQSLSLRYRHKHPRMIEAMARLQQTKDRLKQFLARTVRNPLDGDYWSQHRERLSDLESEESLGTIRDLLISRRAVLESEISSQNQLFGSVLSQIETREVNTKQTASEVYPQEAARLPGGPVYPQKASMVIRASAFGLFAGLGLAFLFQFLDNKLHTVADVESQLGLPVLSAVAALDPRKIIKDQKKHQEDNAWVPGRENWDPTIVFRVEGANSHYAEMFRVLRTSLSLLGPAEERKVTMLTSALPSEGKTLTACNLAVALAQQGLRTLLVDLDLRKPSVHKLFGLEKDAQLGMVDLLAGRAALNQVVISGTGQTNLSLILSGTKAPNPGELLEVGRLDRLLTELRKHFDHIVFDTAPLLAVPDSRILAPLADNLALVVRGESTPVGPVRRALEILDGSDVTPEGIVFNGYIERRTLMGQNYSYGYYRYGKYGYGTYGTYGTVYGEDEKRKKKKAKAKAKAKDQKA